MGYSPTEEWPHAARPQQSLAPARWCREIDQAMSEAGIAPDLESLATRWKATVEGVFEEATLERPSYDAWMYTGGKIGHHTEHLGFLLAEMQYLPRAYPDATVW